MSEQHFYNSLLIAWFILAAITFGLLFFVVAPYGRHAKSGWGPSIDNKLAWIIMEAPSPLLFGALFWLGDNQQTLPLLAFFLLWEAHYIHRAFIYPLRLRSGVKSMPLIVASSGLFFNIVNAYLNGRYLFTLSAGYPTRWLTDPRFLLGLILFLTGFIINRTPTTSCATCATPVNQPTKYRMVAYIAGYPAPTTSANSSNGQAGPSPPPP
jgi:hypothetical protein